MSIEVNGIHLIYPDGQNPTLSDITFCAPQGALTIVIGKTGAGKSTLLEVLSGQREPNHGSVTVGGELLWRNKKLNQHVLMQVGYVFQYPEQQLFSQTVSDEFRYSLKPLRLSPTQQDTRAAEALSQLGLPLEFNSRSPFTLSSGQKRRIALATTLATFPQWLMLDEPTAGLDAHSVRQLVETLTKLRDREGRGIIIATHDLDAFLPVADRVIVLSRGRLVGNFSPSELNNDPDILVQAGVGLPAGLRLQKKLLTVGVNISATVDPIGAARQLVDAIQARSPVRQTQAPLLAHHSAALPLRLKVAHKEAMAAPRSDDEHSAAHIRGVSGMDPRIKWCIYILSSVGFMVQSTWLGLAVSLATLLAFGVIINLPFQRVTRLIRPLLIVTLVSLVIAGLKFGRNDHAFIHLSSCVGFDPVSTIPTLYSLCRLYLVMVASIMFTFCTSPLQMKQGLSTVLKGLSRLKIPVEAFALGAALFLRFIPMIMKELQRFANIARVRGKRPTRRAQIWVRDLRVILIPFVIAILQLGDELATAMEARGYDSLKKQRTSSVQLRLHRTDWIAFFVGTMIFVLLLFTSRWFHA